MVIRTDWCTDGQGIHTCMTTCTQQYTVYVQMVIYSCTPTDNVIRTRFYSTQHVQTLRNRYRNAYTELTNHLTSRAIISSPHTHPSFRYTHTQSQNKSKHVHIDTTCLIIISPHPITHHTSLWVDAMSSYFIMSGLCHYTSLWVDSMSSYFIMSGRYVIILHYEWTLCHHTSLWVDSMSLYFIMSGLYVIIHTLHSTTPSFITVS